MTNSLFMSKLQGANSNVPTDLSCAQKFVEVFQIFTMTSTGISLLTLRKRCFPITLKIFWGQTYINQKLQV